MSSLRYLENVVTLLLDAEKCIGCGMCVSACTMVSHDPRFPGPAALNRVFTLQRDSRDGAHADRSTALLTNSCEES